MRIKRKSLLMLSLILSVLLVATCMSVQAGFSGSETTSAIYLDFESKDELSVIDGQIATGYYSLADKGYGDSAGSLLL
ncbi:MAG: hypothetical protein IJC78_05630 [Clostridia bacterium]|nr:hypothetical protein [Clostridia bacterium]